MKMEDGEHFLDAGVDPYGLLKPTAFWTVAIAAGVIAGPSEVTVLTAVEVSAQSSGAAPLNVAHQAFLVRGQRILLAIRLPELSEDVSDLEPSSLRRRGRSVFMRGVFHRLSQSMTVRGAQEVERTDGAPELLHADLQVEHGGLDRGMTEELLDDRKRDPRSEQVTCESMPQRMRRYAFVEVEFFYGSTESSANGLL